VLWLAFDKVHDRIFVVDEIYERSLRPEDLALAVLKKDAAFERELNGVIDSAAFAEIGLGAEGGKGSRGHFMNSCGCRWTGSEKGAGAGCTAFQLSTNGSRSKVTAAVGWSCFETAGTWFARYPQ
jgi:hypothetical protein